MKSTEINYFNRVRNYISEATFQLLKEENIDFDKDLDDYGFNSITSTELINFINDEFNLDLMPTIFFELEVSTINSLTDHICSNFNEELSEKYLTNENFEKESDSPIQDINPTNFSEANEGINQLEEENHLNITTDDFQYDGSIRKKASSHEEEKGESIAIIGMEGKFPDSDSVSEFWDNLVHNKNMISKIPKDRFDCDVYDDPKIQWGGFMKGIKSFDSEFFNIPGMEADYMDPQHRLFMETVWKAIEDAGYKASEFHGTKTGVFAGIGSQDYSEIVNNNMDTNKPNPYALTGLTSFMMVNRVSSSLNLKGPSEPIDTACSSSLVAINRAIEAINSGACDTAIVGGVNVIITPSIYLSFSAAGMLSNSPDCRVFDSNANGTIRSEGVGVIILKKYNQAIKDGDNIHAVIRSSAVNHKGKSKSLTAPSVQSQVDLIVDSYKKNNIDPRSIDYIETHSTGTKMGDPIEINALQKAFKELGYEKSEENDVPCFIGSLKSAVGHMEAASGMGSIIKVILSMKNDTMIGINNLENLSEYIKLDNSPFQISRENKKWIRREGEVPKKAGISSFGFGGVNAHLVIEEHIDLSKSSVDVPENPSIFTLSAKEPSGLLEEVNKIINWIETNDFMDRNVSDICYTLQNGREEWKNRLAFEASSIGEILSKLNDIVNSNGAGDESISIGEVSQNNIIEVLKLLSEDEGMTQVIKKWVENDELNKVAKIWVYGYKVNWDIMYNEIKPKRVSLPTYTFEKTIHWIEGQNQLSREQKENIKNCDNSFILRKNISESSKRLKIEIINLISNFLSIPSSKINVTESLESIGVDSIILTQLLNIVRDYIPTIDFEKLYNCHNIEEILTICNELKNDLDYINDSSNEGGLKESYEKKDNYNELIKLNNISNGRPIFWFHGGFGGVEVYRLVAENINRPFYGIQARGYMDNEEPFESLDEMTEYYIKILSTVQPEGPFDLGGLSFGGVVAHEVARKMQLRGKEVNTLIMLESIFVDEDMKKDWLEIPQDDLIKDRLLRVTNLLMSFAGTKQDELKLISGNEINLELNNSEFLNQLANIAIKRGVKKNLNQLKKMILQLDKTLSCLDIASTAYKPQKLPRPADIHSYYFCNSDSTLFGDEESFYRLVDKGRVYDYEIFSKKWSELTPGLEIKKLDSSSHLTILTEEKSLNTIKDFCEKLYS
ncbi:thioesterase domain-containing protein [Bacillus subtilis]|uniref:type I polyketide synthase n=1 Tax=Bacillus subtilis TaxID=1423 RepID=UPI001362EB52|nr:type I polyketide synthase [Bacillus subtilis]MCO8149071.1 thioesterase domain-containing protein [Bacillus subtilis]MDQ4710332.1 type I polyketide synthase [Bacillus subtilis]MEC2180486.1 type I polyketide synthase [Bacillus subtilis]QHM17827.1 Polyketide synthase PksR [Bacillus subtilis]CAF1842863.1 Polyketide synthase PksR [Bacillus subtilis]